MGFGAGDADPEKSRGRGISGSPHSASTAQGKSASLSVVANLFAPASASAQVTFNRAELNRILGLYGRMVASGEWRDYAIDFLKDCAVFSIFRRASEVPIYRIVKDPKLARRQGAYSVVSATGLILRRGHELDRVISVLEKSARLVVAKG